MTLYRTLCRWVRPGRLTSKTTLQGPVLPVGARQCGTPTPGPADAKGSSWCV